ncbi:MAG: glucose-6-phosphate isomerase [Candidatus Gracilibacteria bacterium]|nr:glucose-6-phosphate isomerase [Candidatus Gracilibacteria bacterium]
MQNLKLNINNNLIEKSEFKANNEKIKNAYKQVLERSGLGNEFLGWTNTKEIISEKELENIKRISKTFKDDFEKIVVIGIGGSYLGSKAIISALSGNFSDENIIFAGYNLDSNYLYDLRKYLENKNYAIIVISKSGGTLEPALTFRILLEDLRQKYGENELKNRVVAITDEKKGILKELANNLGLETFKVPDDIGGRYSVLTAVGLLPIAIAGFDIDKLLKGASDMETLLKENNDISENPAMIYANFRNILLEKGKNIEILASFDSRLKLFSEWWKQLFGESDGKDKKGIFPTNLVFSTDLHSMGQYIQDGQRILFETFLSVENPKNDLEIPFIEGDIDKLNYLSGKTIDFINKGASSGAIQAHNEGGVPTIEIIIPELNEYYLGQLIYFFEFSCAIGGYMLGVNPFNQPGVESYKKYMMNNI